MSYIVHVHACIFSILKTNLSHFFLRSTECQKHKSVWFLRQFFRQRYNVVKNTKVFKRYINIWDVSQFLFHSDSCFNFLSHCQRDERTPKQGMYGWWRSDVYKRQVHIYISGEVTWRQLRQCLP